jgi:hypothetical protein
MNTLTKSALSDIVDLGTRQVFAHTCRIDLECGRNELTRYEGAGYFSDMPVLGDLSGYVVICLPRAMAWEVGTRFLGREVDEMGQEMIDLLGEINNILAGRIKYHLDKKGVTLELGLPEVKRMKNLAELEDHPVSLAARSFESREGVLWTAFLMD